MRLQFTDTIAGLGSFTIWLSARDTYAWAHRSGVSWPCSTLSDRRVCATFDRRGIVDLSIDGRDGDCDAHELNACIADHLRASGKVPANSPIWDLFPREVQP